MLILEISLRYEPPKYDNIGNNNSQNMSNHMVSNTMHFDNTEPFMDRVAAMVSDVMITNEVNASEQPHALVQAFHDILEEAQRYLRDRCSNQNELSNDVRFMSVKSDHNMPHNLFQWDDVINAWELAIMCQKITQI